MFEINKSVENSDFGDLDLSFDRLRMVSKVEPFRVSIFGFRVSSFGEWGLP
jgi:hypothetical protein